jgi:(heptosyl)LPS beta-1,4-glucosyltransferase
MINKISAIIICKNEAINIRRCLESIQWADEIIVVDSGSTDSTLDIVAEYTDKVFINTEWPGYGLQKRLAESKAANDWLLAIDADEVVTEQLRGAIIEILGAAAEKTVYRVNRLTNFYNKFIKHSGWHPDRIVRVYNKKHYRYNEALVHESVSCEQACKVDLPGLLLHYTFQSLEEHMDKQNLYAKAWSEDQYRKGRKVRLYEMLFRSLFAFFRQYVIRLGVLDGYPGFLISVIQMQYTFNKYSLLKFKNSIENKS